MRGKGTWKSYHKKPPALYFVCQGTHFTSADIERCVLQNDLLNLKCFSNTKNSSFCSATPVSYQSNTQISGETLK